MTDGKIFFHSGSNSYVELQILVKEITYRLILINHMHNDQLSYGYRLFYDDLEVPRKYTPIDRRLFHFNNNPPPVMDSLWDKIVMIE